MHRVRGSAAVSASASRSSQRSSRAASPVSTHRTGVHDRSQLTSTFVVLRPAHPPRRASRRRPATARRHTPASQPCPNLIICPPGSQCASPGMADLPPDRPRPPSPPNLHCISRPSLRAGQAIAGPPPARRTRTHGIITASHRASQPLTVLPSLSFLEEALPLRGRLSWPLRHCDGSGEAAIADIDAHRWWWLLVGAPIAALGAHGAHRHRAHRDRV